MALKVNYVSGEELTSLKWSHGIGFEACEAYVLGEILANFKVLVIGGILRREIKSQTLQTHTFGLVSSPDVQPRPVTGTVKDLQDPGGMTSWQRDVKT